MKFLYREKSASLVSPGVLSLGPPRCAFILVSGQSIKRVLYICFLFFFFFVALMTVCKMYAFIVHGDVLTQCTTHIKFSVVRVVFFFFGVIVAKHVSYVKARCRPTIETNISYVSHRSRSHGTLIYTAS